MKKTDEVVIEQKPTNTVISNEWKIQKIPEGVLDINEITVKKKAKSANTQQERKIRYIEQLIKKQEQKKKSLVKTASVNDIRILLAKKNYEIERDRNYKCRRWIISKGDKQWHIRFNDPLIYAIAYINNYGIVKFLKEHSMKSKYI